MSDELDLTAAREETLIAAHIENVRAVLDRGHAVMRSCGQQVTHKNVQKTPMKLQIKGYK